MTSSPGNIAIVGRGLVTALGFGLDAVWDALLKNTCGIQKMQRFPQGKYHTDFVAELPVDLLSRLQKSGDSLALQLGLEVIDQARSQAGNAGCLLPEQRTGLVLSTTKADIAPLEDAVSGNCPASKAGNVSLYRLARNLARQAGVNGPVLTVSNACASGLLAQIQAARLLVRGRADFMIVVGLDLLSDFILSGFSSLKALSTQPCRPFDKRRDGLSLGEGAGALILAREDGLSAGPVAGSIKGWGGSNDANHLTGPSRDGGGLALAIQRALAQAGLQPEAIDYINAHGTGTVYSDAMEAKAFYSVFGAENAPPISSLKGYLGHTLGAAGIIETVLCTRAMQENTAPGTLGLEDVGVEESLQILSSDQPGHEMANVLKVNSGFGGVNAALVLGRGC
jgi:3-oxoacyl-(acyl-carrier-protein) synthase